jgi:hypothetical protein
MVRGFDSTNFAITDGATARLSVIADYSTDLSADNNAGFTIINIQTTGIYELSYSISFEVDGNPDIERMTTLFTQSGVGSAACSPSALQSSTGGFAVTYTSVIDNDQDYHVVSGSEIAALGAGDCLALKASESSASPASNNRAEMFFAYINIKRLR